MMMMSNQNQENHDDLKEMEKLTDLQETQFKQYKQEQNRFRQNPLQDIYLNRSRENSNDSDRARSRSFNERKRNYIPQQGQAKNSDNPNNFESKEDQILSKRSSRFTESTNSNVQNFENENDQNQGNNGVEYSKINFTTNLQQLQDLASNIPSIKQDNQSSYRHARRLYVGNIPETINQEYLSEWLYRSLEAAGGLQPTLSSENPIVKCEIDPKGRFAFTELRSIEETTCLLQLDGIILWHRQLRIRRPTEYEKFPQVQGQFEIPQLNFDLFKTVGIVIIPTVVDDGPNKLFLANLPTKMDELMILDELKLRDMGEIKAFHLVKDNQTNQSKGYAFFEFKDPSLSDKCIESLHGMSYAGRTLTCKRSLVGGQGNKLHQNNQQNNNKQGNTNNIQKTSNQENTETQQLGTTEGVGFLPNYQQQNNNKGVNQNYKRRNFGNQNNNNDDTMAMIQGNNENNRRFNNNNRKNQYQNGNTNGFNNKIGKPNQWRNEQMIGQNHTNGQGMDEYYQNSEYDINQGYSSYQQENQNDFQ